MNIREFFDELGFFLVVLAGVLFIVGVSYLSYYGLSGHDVMGRLSLAKYDAVSRIACGSGSMGLMLDCNDQALLREVTLGSNLSVGHVYTYTSGNESIIHRYLGCVNPDCSRLFFRGDNNKVGEYVNRSLVTYELVGVYYEQ